jgi:hypothetical protein
VELLNIDDPQLKGLHYLEGGDSLLVHSASTRTVIYLFFTPVDAEEGYDLLEEWPLFGSVGGQR